MQNSWATPGSVSVVKPALPASGDPLLPPPHPPDPPDPSSNLSPIQFPPLSTSPLMSRSELRRSLISKPTTDTIMVQAGSQSLDVVSLPSRKDLSKSPRRSLSRSISKSRSPSPDRKKSPPRAMSRSRSRSRSLSKSPAKVREGSD